MANVTKIADMGAYVQLMEYGNKGAVIRNYLYIFLKLTRC